MKIKFIELVMDTLLYFIIILVIITLFIHFGFINEQQPFFYAVCMTIGWSIWKGISSMFKGRKKN